VHEHDRLVAGAFVEIVEDMPSNVKVPMDRRR